MILKRYVIPIQTLKALPKDELFFNVQIGLFFNELVALEKCRIMSGPRPGPEEDSVLMSARVAQLNFFTRLLAGKLFEGWELVRKQYFATRLCQEYDLLLSTEGAEALANLKRYFSRGSNSIKRLRNVFAFHYASDELKEQVFQFIRAQGNNVAVELYMSTHEGNCFYSLNHTIVNYLMVVDLDRHGNHVLTDEQIGALVLEVLTDVQKVSKWFMGFCIALRAIFHERCLRLQECHAEEITLSDPPSIDQISIPFFLSPPA